MKTYNETFFDVMEKIDKYDLNKKKQRKKALTAGISAFVFCLLGAAIFFGVKNTGDVKLTPAVKGEETTADTGRGTDMPIMPGGAVEATGTHTQEIAFETSMPAVTDEQSTVVPNEEPSNAVQNENNSAYFTGEQSTFVPSEEDPAQAHGFCMVADTDNPDTVDYITLIRSYPGTGSKIMSPRKGEAVISLALGGAMEEYGDDMVKYYVRIDVIPVDGEIKTGSAYKAVCEEEMKRLTGWINENNLSDVVGIDEYGKIGDDENHVYSLFAHCSTAFVKNFPVTGEYGYILSLYDEMV